MTHRLLTLVFVGFLITFASAVVLPSLAAPNEAGVDLSPDRERSVRISDVVTYTHTLVNTGATTDTFTLSASSSEGWDVQLSEDTVELGPEASGLIDVVLTVSETCGIVDTTTVTATSQADASVTDTVIDTTAVPCVLYLSAIFKRWPPIPYAPVLGGIDNSDQDTTYTVSWSGGPLARSYVLEEASNGDFSDARVVAEGPATSWTVATPGKTPGTYYYRVRARNSWGESGWSNVHWVRVYPLFVGFEARWDGNGYIRGDWSYDVGRHVERRIERLTDPDTAEVQYHSWYAPNPRDWEERFGRMYYSVSTGHFKSSSLPGDPSWKWGTRWILPYDVVLQDGQTRHIDGQPFSVSGPHVGYSAFGKQVRYWRLVNDSKFLYWDGGGDYKQYVHEGDIVLHYDAGGTRLLLHRDILRRDYYEGEPTSDTVQYVSNLTGSNAFGTSQVVTTQATEESIRESTDPGDTSTSQGLMDLSRMLAVPSW